jgi:hypothetical protein
VKAPKPSENEESETNPDKKLKSVLDKFSEEVIRIYPFKDINSIYYYYYYY